MKKCIPIIATSFDEIKEIARNIENKAFDMVELRIDGIKGPFKMKEFIEAWNALRSEIKKPVIVTMRTKKQGGKRELYASEYNAFIRKIIYNIKPEYIDIEPISCGNAVYVKMLTSLAQKRGIKVILSNHDLFFTEKERDIEMGLCKLKYMGADIPKVAYMANSEEDVENLIGGAKKASAKVGELIAIAMGELGKRTRTDGDEFGSVITFLKPVGSSVTASDELGQI